MLISEVVVLYLVPPCISALLPSPTTQALLWEPGCGTHSILDGQVSGAPACVSACLCDSARSAVCVHACACARARARVCVGVGRGLAVPCSRSAGPRGRRGSESTSEDVPAPPRWAGPCRCRLPRLTVPSWAVTLSASVGISLVIAVQEGHHSSLEPVPATLTAVTPLPLPWAAGGIWGDSAVLPKPLRELTPRWAPGSWQ